MSSSWWSNRWEYNFWQWRWWIVWNVGNAWKPGYILGIFGILWIWLSLQYSVVLHSSMADDEVKILRRKFFYVKKKMVNPVSIFVFLILPFSLSWSGENLCNFKGMNLIHDVLRCSTSFWDSSLSLGEIINL